MITFDMGILAKHREETLRQEADHARHVRAAKKAREEAHAASPDAEGFVAWAIARAGRAPTRRAA
jgi:hypothetical protein